MKKRITLVFCHNLQPYQQQKVETKGKKLPTAIEHSFYDNKTSR